MISSITILSRNASIPPATHTPDDGLRTLMVGLLDHVLLSGDFGGKQVQDWLIQLELRALQQESANLLSLSSASSVFLRRR